MVINTEIKVLTIINSSRYCNILLKEDLRNYNSLIDYYSSNIKKFDEIISTKFINKTNMVELYNVIDYILNCRLRITPINIEDDLIIQKENLMEDAAILAKGTNQLKKICYEAFALDLVEDTLSLEKLSKEINSEDQQLKNKLKKVIYHMLSSMKLPNELFILLDEALLNENENEIEKDEQTNSKFLNSAAEINKGLKEKISRMLLEFFKFCYNLVCEKNIIESLLKTKLKNNVIDLLKYSPYTYNYVKYKFYREVTKMNLSLYIYGNISLWNTDTKISNENEIMLRIKNLKTLTPYGVNLENELNLIKTLRFFSKEINSCFRDFFQNKVLYMLLVMFIKNKNKGNITILKNYINEPHNEKILKSLLIMLLKKYIEHLDLNLEQEQEQLEKDFETGRKLNFCELLWLFIKTKKNYLFREIFATNYSSIAIAENTENKSKDWLYKQVYQYLETIIHYLAIINILDSEQLNVNSFVIIKQEITNLFRDKKVLSYKYEDPKIEEHQILVSIYEDNSKVLAKITYNPFYKTKKDLNKIIALMNDMEEHFFCLTIKICDKIKSFNKDVDPEIYTKIQSELIKKKERKRKTKK